MNAEKLLSPTPIESNSTIQARQLLESWKDQEYRAEFVRERVRSSVALQIRALREQRNGMTQKQLGIAIGKAQTWISVLEDPEYGKMSVATLLSLAQAFDTDLEIKFRPFSRALHELTKQDHEYFVVRSFDEERADLENATALGWITPNGKWSDILRAAQLLARVEPSNPSITSAVERSASGALQAGREISQIEYVAAIPSAVGGAMNEASLPIEVHSANRTRKYSRLARRKESSWRKRKPPTRAINNRSISGEAKTMNPSMQTVFTFSQVSGI